MRLLVLILSMSAATTSISASQRTQGADQLIDPIITGVTVTKEHLAAWKKRKRAAQDCPACAVSQPFPDDVPTKISVKRD